MENKKGEKENDIIKNSSQEIKDVSKAALMVIGAGVSFGLLLLSGMKKFGDILENKNSRK